VAQPPLPAQTVVIDDEGVQGTIGSGALDAGEVWITFDQDQRVRVPAELLHRRQDGRYELPLRFRQLKGRAETSGPNAQTTNATVIPVIREEVRVDKRKVETGRVRITKQVSEREETIDVPLLQERVQVERVPVERIVEEPVAARYEGDTLVIPVMEEVLVIEKKLLLKEEVRVTQVKEMTQHRENVPLRSEEVSVEREETRRDER